jgi:hypothetical protein
MTGFLLGPFSGRGLNPARPNEYTSLANIDFTAAIQPAEIITDNMNRPAIENQRRVPPPGPNTLDRGVAGPLLDATGRGFSGWDMSRQIRLKVFKGNPDKVPPEPVRETTNNDPLVNDRPIPAYPSDDPANPLLKVVGNDDAGVTDEDPFPYDQGAGTPGQGTRGTLRSFDHVSVAFEDGFDHTGTPPGENGDTYRRRVHFREFVRVQLGNTWYRCSDFGLWRWHMFAKRLSGKWGPEPGFQDLLDDSTNDDF